MSQNTASLASQLLAELAPKAHELKSYTDSHGYQPLLVETDFSVENHPACLAAFGNKLARLNKEVKALQRELEALFGQCYCNETDRIMEEAKKDTSRKGTASSKYDVEYRKGKVWMSEEYKDIATRLADKEEERDLCKSMYDALNAKTYLLTGEQKRKINQ